MTDRFDRAKAIASGERDAETPCCEEVKAWIDRSPATQAGYFLGAAVLNCIAKGFFKDDDTLLSYIGQFIRMARDPLSMLRGQDD